MRICFATPYYVPELRFGGPPRKIHALAKGLLQHGHSIRVLTFRSSSDTAGDHNPVDGVLVERLRWIGRGLRQFPVNSRSARVAVADCEIVECFGLYNILSPFIASTAKRIKRPFLLEPLGMYPPRARNQLGKRIFNRLFTDKMVRDAAAVVVASETEAEDLKAIVKPEKIFRRRNGISIEEFAQLPPGEELKRRSGIENGERVVLYVGRLSPIKNLEQLIHAFERANVRGAKLILVGPGEVAYETRLRALVRQKKLDDRVIFAGPLYDDNQKTAFAAADLFVLSSLNESFGNAAGEAVAANVPVLLTETCGIAPLIHGRAGMAVPLGVASLAEGIRVMLDPVKRERFLVDREQVKRELSWDEPVAQTIGLYERILAESGKSQSVSRNGR